VIGTVCVLRPEKGLPLLLEAFAAISASLRGVKLLVVGSGPVRDELAALSERLGVAQHCHFEPSVSDVALWMKGIDIFVLPSLSEALSNSMMEAMACGCCVVASDVGGNPELVEDSKSGLLFPRGDSEALALRLQRLIGSRELIETYAEAGRNKISSQFTIAAAAGRMQSIYEEFLSQ
jgi:glycosyltransferase involved in cell wall biosynthesis